MGEPARRASAAEHHRFAEARGRGSSWLLHLRLRVAFREAGVCLSHRSCQARHVVEAAACDGSLSNRGPESKRRKRQRPSLAAALAALPVHPDGEDAGRPKARMHPTSTGRNWTSLHQTCLWMHPMHPMSQKHARLLRYIICIQTVSGAVPASGHVEMLEVPRCARGIDRLRDARDAKRHLQLQRNQAHAGRSFIWQARDPDAGDASPTFPGASCLDDGVVEHLCMA